MLNTELVLVKNKSAIKACSSKFCVVSAQSNCLHMKALTTGIRLTYTTLNKKQEGPKNKEIIFAIVAERFF